MPEKPKLDYAPATPNPPEEQLQLSPRACKRIGAGMIIGGLGLFLWAFPWDPNRIPEPVDGNSVMSRRAVIICDSLLNGSVVAFGVGFVMFGSKLAKSDELLRESHRRKSH